MHLGPLMHVSWLQSIDDEGLKNKNLEQLVDLIKGERKLRMSRHQRRLQLLKAKRDNLDCLYTLDIKQNKQNKTKLWSVLEFEMMTSDEMIIHLFAN